jgi:uncharacterized membrane protein YqjE
MPDNSGTHLECVMLIALPPTMIRPKCLCVALNVHCLVASDVDNTYRFCARVTVELLLVVHVLPKRWQKRSSLGQLTSVVVEVNTADESDEG